MVPRVTKKFYLPLASTFGFWCHPSMHIDKIIVLDFIHFTSSERSLRLIWQIANFFIAILSYLLSQPLRIKAHYTANSRFTRAGQRFLTVRGNEQVLKVWKLLGMLLLLLLLFRVRLLIEVILSMTYLVMISMIRHDIHDMSWDSQLLLSWYPWCLCHDIHDVRSHDIHEVRSHDRTD